MYLIFLCYNNGLLNNGQNGMQVSVIDSEKHASK